MKQALKEFVSTFDILNTIHGGVSEPYLSLRENDKGREVHVRVPGVSREALQAEIINNNHLTVFYNIPVVSAGKLMHLPKVVYHEVVPDFINVLNIHAAWDENEFVVKLPFGSLEGGNHRKVKSKG